MKRLAKLVPGREYLFTHKRKRTFRALYRGIVRAPVTDAADEYYLECEVDPFFMESHGLEPMDAAKSVVNIRPSLISLVQEAPANSPPFRQGRPPADHEQVGIPERGIRGYYQHLRLLLKNLRIG